MAAATSPTVPAATKTGQKKAARGNAQGREGRGAPQFRKTKMCRFQIVGVCGKGSECPFAHHVEELQALPDLCCTKLCKVLIQTGACKNPHCRYAHNKEELRLTSSFHKTKICRFFAQDGNCALGSKCNFAHSDCEIRNALETASGFPVESLTELEQTQSPSSSSRASLHLPARWFATALDKSGAGLEAEQRLPPGLADGWGCSLSSIARGSEESFGTRVNQTLFNGVAATVTELSAENQHHTLAFKTPESAPNYEPAYITSIAGNRFMSTTDPACALPVGSRSDPILLHGASLSRRVDADPSFCSGSDATHQLQSAALHPPSRRESGHPARRTKSSLVVDQKDGVWQARNVVERNPTSGGKLMRAVRTSESTLCTLNDNDS